jgi:hypothetical protein
MAQFCFGEYASLSRNCYHLTTPRSHVGVSLELRRVFVRLAVAFSSSLHILSLFY